MHADVLQNKGFFISERKVLYFEIVVKDIHAVRYSPYGRLFLKQVENSVAARKSLREIARQGRNGDHGAETSEHGRHADDHFSQRKLAGVDERYSDGKRQKDYQRNRQLGRRPCLRYAFFIFFVSRRSSSERLLTSFSRSSPALFNTISFTPLMLSRK